MKRILCLFLVVVVLVVGSPPVTFAADPAPNPNQGQLVSDKTPFWTRLKERINKVLERLRNQEENANTKSKTKPRDEESDEAAFSYKVYAGFPTATQAEKKKYINQLQPYAIFPDISEVYCFDDDGREAYQWSPWEVPITIKFPAGWCMDFKYNNLNRDTSPEAQSGWSFFKKQLSPGLLTKAFIPTRPLKPVTEESQEQEEQTEEEKQQEQEKQAKSEEQDKLTTDLEVAFFMGNNFTVDYTTDCNKEMSFLQGKENKRPYDINRLFCYSIPGFEGLIMSHIYEYNNYDGDFTAKKYSSDHMHNVIMNAYDMAKAPLGRFGTQDPSNATSFTGYFDEWVSNKAAEVGYIRNKTEEDKWKSTSKVKAQAMVVFNVYVRCAPPPAGNGSVMPQLVQLFKDKKQYFTVDGKSIVNDPAVYFGGCRPELGAQSSGYGNWWAPTGERVYMAVKGQLLYVIRTDSPKLFWEECRPSPYRQPTAVESKNQCVIKSVIGADRLVDEVSKARSGSSSGNNSNSTEPGRTYPSKHLMKKLKEWNEVHFPDSKKPNATNPNSNYYLVYNVELRDKCLPGYVMNNQTGGRCVKPADVQKLLPPSAPKFKRCIYGEVVQESQPCPEDAYKNSTSIPVYVPPIN